MMKTTIIAFTVAASLAAGAAVAAEPFNDRGIDFAATVQPDPNARRQPPTPQPRGFNDRGIDYFAIAPLSSNKPRQDVRMPPARGFNDRDHVAYPGGGHDSFNVSRSRRLGYSR